MSIGITGITGITLTQHAAGAERERSGSAGPLTTLLHEISVAAKVISREVNRAGILGILGSTGEINVQGEEVQKLDAYANEVLLERLEASGQAALLASEELEEPRRVAGAASRLAVLFDPLDGSSNIDTNASIGTIFSILALPEEGEPRVEHLLQAGARQVAAGYAIYGSSTILVYTAGAGVHGFTLDRGLGEFLLNPDHENLEMPESGSTYSVNEGYYERWSEAQRRVVEHFRGRSGSKARYIGSLVADFHRTLVKGGIFMYPPDAKSPEGKLRYLYEASPLALICERAGGLASTGTEPILDFTPESLHQRVPLFIGSKGDVSRALEILAGGD